MIWVGTSGFQYPEWKGTFYPRDLSAAKMLPFYAERFATTEINYSFYRIPAAKTLTNWSAETPETFHFSFKAPKKITHINRLTKTDEVTKVFSNAILTIKNKLGMVLFQLPPFLKKDLPLLEDFIGSLPSELNCAFEFRHASWFDDSVFDCLRSGHAALCISDTEKLSAPVVFTASQSYFRLRQPNYAKKDLARWADIINDQSSRMEHIYVYFKHEETGTGPNFAKTLIDRLDLNLVQK